MARIGALRDILKRQRDSLNDLLAVAGRQQQAILAQDREAIEATTKAQDELFAQLQALEHDRVQAQRALASRVRAEAEGADAGAGGSAPDGSPGPAHPGLHHAARDLDFDGLLHALTGPERHTLAAARDEARKLLMELSTVNQINQQLLAQELALVDLYMSVLNPDMSAEAYSEPGQARKTSSAAVAFDARA